jgi:hypothetical protein
MLDCDGKGIIGQETRRNHSVRGAVVFFSKS